MLERLDRDVALPQTQLKAAGKALSVIQQLSLSKPNRCIVTTIGERQRLWLLSVSVRFMENEVGFYCAFDLNTFLFSFKMFRPLLQHVYRV